MQADGGFIEDEEGVRLLLVHLAGELEALRLAARERRRGLAQREIAKPEIRERLKLGLGFGDAARRHAQQLVYREREHIGKRELLGIRRRFLIRAIDACVGVFQRQAHCVCFLAIARAVAIGAGDVHVGEELHVKRYLPRAVAGGATQAARVVREGARLELALLGRGCGCEGAAQVIHDAGVGCHRRADVRTDGCRVDEMDTLNARRDDTAHMCGQLSAVKRRLQCGDEALENEGGLSRSRDAGDDCHASQGNLHGKRFHGMQGQRLELDGAFLEHDLIICTFAHMHVLCAREIGSDAGSRVCLDLPDSALGDDATTARA